MHERPSEEANTRAIRLCQAVDLAADIEDEKIKHERSSWFLHGAAYFGEWKRDFNDDRWLPDGRGIVINYKQQKCYFGHVVAGRLRGFGKTVPFVVDETDRRESQGEFEDDRLARLTATAYAELETKALQAFAHSAALKKIKSFYMTKKAGVGNAGQKEMGGRP